MAVNDKFIVVNAIGKGQRCFVGIADILHLCCGCRPAVEFPGQVNMPRRAACGRHVAERVRLGSMGVSNRNRRSSQRRRLRQCPHQQAKADHKTEPEPPAGAVEQKCRH